MPWDIAVRSAVQRREAYALLERGDADQAIRSLTELETYYAIKALGSEDAAPFLAVIGTEQARALFDLDIWHGDRADVDDALVWLGAFREVSLERAQTAARSLDPELLALIFRRRLMIARVTPDDEGAPVPEWVENPPEELQPLIETPDRRFIIAARAVDENDEIEGRDGEIDEEERKAVLQLVDDLYRDPDFETAASVLRMAETDQSSDLEETAQRFRSARLEDLGFPPLDRALDIYARVDPARVLGTTVDRPPSGELRLPAIHASRLSDGLLRTALRAIEDPELVHAIEGELVPLANAALVADHVEPGDLERLGEVLDRVRAYLELALAFGGEGDPLRIAKDRLTRLPLRTLFAIGWSITLELAARARALTRRSAFRLKDAPLGLLDEADRAVLEALLARRPSFSTVLDGERPARMRAIKTLRDVEKLRAVLSDLESAADAAAALDLSGKNLALGPGIEPPEPAERSLDLLLATAAANALLGRAPDLVPLDRAALIELASRTTGGAFASADVDHAVDVVARAGKLDPAALFGTRIRRGLAALGEALGPFSGKGEIDPRYIGEVVRRLK